MYDIVYDIVYDIYDIICDVVCTDGKNRLKTYDIVFFEDIVYDIAH